MHIGIIRRFFADDWPMKLWFGAAVAGAIAFLIGVYVPGASPSNVTEIVIVTLVCIASVVVVGLLAGLVGSLVLGPFYRYVATTNGAPFHPGDHVVILSGKERGRLTTVYSLWQGMSVRVELGEPAKTTFKDVYTSYQLLRVGSPPDGPA